MWSAARQLRRIPMGRALAAVTGASLLLPAHNEEESRRWRYSPLQAGSARCDGVIRPRNRGMLDHMADLWKVHEHDTWPWMWLTRQQGHKCHVFVGNSPDLLEKMREAVAADKAATLVFVGKREELLRCGAEEEELDRLGCACLEGNVEKVDAQTCVLMTRDERMLEFDSLTVMWASPRTRTGRRLSGEAQTAQEKALAREAAKKSEEEDEEEKRRSPMAGQVEIYPSRGDRVEDVQVARGCRAIVKRKSLHAGGEGLHQIVEAWKLSRTDTWPWVWLWRNPQGPLHVLVGSSREVLEAARQRASESPDNQVVIIGRRAELLRHASEDEYDRLRCAIVEEELEELDAHHGIAMLHDERLLEFHSLTVFHAESSATI